MTTNDLGAIYVEMIQRETVDLCKNFSDLHYRYLELLCQSWDE